MAKKSRRKQRDGSAGKARTNPERAGSSGGGSGKNDGKAAENSLLEWIKSLVVAFVLFLFIRSFLIHTFVIISGSMEETLLVGDLLLVNRAAVGSPVPGTPWRIPGYAKMERGDILVFDPHHEEDLKLVKRLVGLAGDTLAMRDKVLFINGQPQDEPYVRHLEIRDDSHPWMSWQQDFVLREGSEGPYNPTRDNWGPLVVPPEHVFMMGDNRDTSLDSRYWGFLEDWRLEGRAVLVYFSYNKGSLRPFPWLKEIRWSRIGDRVR